MTIEVISNEKVAPEAEQKPADMAALNETNESSEKVEAKPGEEIAAEADKNSEASEETDEPGEIETKDDETEEKPKKKSKGGFQRRVDKLTAKAQALEEEKEFWRNEALKAQKPQDQTPEKTARSTDSKRPKPEDFETNDAYVEALTDWKLDLKLKEQEQKRKEDAIKTEFKTKLNTHVQRLNAFKEEHEDFDEVYESAAEGVPYNAAVQQAIVESDLGPDVMFELAKNPKEFKRICSLPALSAAKEIGKIEARLSKTSETPVEKKTTKAPDPVKPVRNRGTTVVKDIYDPNISDSDFYRIRNEQERARLAGR